MSRMQVRPKDGGDAYSPQRDLAYCYAPAMREALMALDEANWTDEVRRLFAQLGVSEEDVSQAVKSLTDAHLTFISDPNVKRADEALSRAGWYGHSARVRYLIYGRLGEVILGGFFLAIRDVRMLGEEPPHPRQIADFIAEGLRVAGREEAFVQAVLDESDQPSSATRPSLAVQLQLTRRALAESRAILREVTKKEGGWHRQALGLIREMEHVNSLGLWSGICRAIKVWWRGRKSPTPDADKQN